MSFGVRASDEGSVRLLCAMHEREMRDDKNVDEIRSLAMIMTKQTSKRNIQRRWTPGTIT